MCEHRTVNITAIKTMVVEVNKKNEMNEFKGKSEEILRVCVCGFSFFLYKFYYVIFILIKKRKFSYVGIELKSKKNPFISFYENHP